MNAVPCSPFPCLIISIETSCDETAVSVLKATRETNGELKSIFVLAHLVESQTESHLPFGGVVPEVAARDHLSKIAGLAEDALAKSGVSVSELDAVAVTVGPGLIGALMVGVLFSQGLSTAIGKPLLAVNHVDAHLAPAILLKEFRPASDIGKQLNVNRDIEYPALALTVSGGHCMLSKLTSPTHREILGSTLDDACGEAFDKVGKLLGLPYPGGPYVEILAKQCVKTDYVLPTSLQDKSNRYGFSYSGLKTAMLDIVRKKANVKTGKISGANLPENEKAELALAFQTAAIGQLENRVMNAMTDFAPKSILVAGGVAANTYFRERFAKLGVKVHFAPQSLCSDNATMIGLHALLNPTDGRDVHAFPRYSPGISRGSNG